jgi:hypothetical protein
MDVEMTCLSRPSSHSPLSTRQGTLILWTSSTIDHVLETVSLDCHPRWQSQNVGSASRAKIHRDRL